MPREPIRGHAAVLEFFRAALSQGRLGQAYLFAGPEGIGKLLVARHLASGLLCEHPSSVLMPCGRCPACAQVAADTHPDLLTLRTPEGRHELPVDEMREFCSRLARKPVRGGRRIGIVEDADDLNPESANCFLKTLEEPAPGTLLLLIATHAERQLATILSRCQVVRFAPLSADDVATILAEHGVEDEVRRARLARLSGGSVSRALALNDDSIWQLRRELLRGITSRRPDFARLAGLWDGFVQDAGKDTAAQRVRTSAVIGFLIDAFRQALRLAHGLPGPACDPEEEAMFRDLADRLGSERLVRLIEACVEADYRVERRVQLILIVESVLEQVTRATSPSGR